MELLIFGLIIFLGVHSVSIIAFDWRTRIVNRIGLLPWQGIYSVIAIVGFILIINGYGLARQDSPILYVPPTWLRHIAVLLLVFVFPLVFAAYLPGRIQTTTKHPMLIATKLWAVAHLLANGRLADIILFGAFLVWAVLDRISLKWRTPLPVQGLPVSRYNDVLVVVLGLGLYAAFIFGVHAWLFGATPVP